MAGLVVRDATSSNKFNKSAAPVLGGSVGAAVGITGDGPTSSKSNIF